MRYTPPPGSTDPNAPYVTGVPGVMRGSPVPAEAVEYPQREIVNAIIAAGIDPDNADLSQLAQAINARILASGGHLLPNSELWLTESGQWTAPVEGWYHVLCIAGGQGSFAHTTQKWGVAGASGEWKEEYRYYHAGDVVNFTIGAGGVKNAGTNHVSPSRIGGDTSFDDITALSAPYDEVTLKFFYYQVPGSDDSLSLQGNAITTACAAGPGGTSGVPMFYGAGGGFRADRKGAGGASIFNYYIHDGYQGAVRLRWHDPALAAGPLPAPALLKARRMATHVADAPETVSLYDPGTGQGSVWRPEDVEAKLAEGLVSAEAWQDICDARAAEDHAAWLASPDTVEERFALLRAERDARLSATDYLVAPDYPLTDEQRTAVISYRQALRDLPAQEGAPWDGGGELTPWPPLPEFLQPHDA